MRCSRVEDLHGARRIAHHDALGDLELEPAGIGARTRESRRELSARCASCRLPRRQVDRDGDVEARFAASGGTARSACSSTQNVSGLMKPICSARPMNRLGRISPCIGCCQRTSASVPITRPVRRSTFG